MPDTAGSVPMASARDYVELLQRIQDGTVRLSDLQVYDTHEPWPAAYEPQVLQAMDTLRRALEQPGALERIVLSEQCRAPVAVLYALAPWPVLDVMLPQLEAAFERVRPGEGELHAYVRSATPRALVAAFESRIAIITRVMSLGSLQVWMRRSVVAAISEDVTLRPGA